MFRCFSSVIERELFPANRTGAVVAAAFFILCSISVRANAQIPCRYDDLIIQAEDCAFTGPPVTAATGISPNGRYVVGWHHQCDQSSNEAWVYDSNTDEAITLPRPPGVGEATARGVNDSGWIVGSYGRANVGGRGFVYKLHENEWIELAPQGSTGSCRADAINSTGQVVGRRSIKGAQSNGSPRNAFIWSEKKGFTDLGVMNGPDSYAIDISDKGTVVGWTGPHLQLLDEDTRGFIYKEGVTTVLGPVPNGHNSIVSAINNQGDFILRGQLQKGEELLSASYLVKDGNSSLLPTPGDFDRLLAIGMNDLAIMAGAVSHSSQSQVFHPTIWSETCAYLVDDFVDQTAELVIGSVTAISEGGTLVVDGRTDSNDPVGVVLTPVWPAAGDTDCNDVVNVDDLGNVFVEWGKCECCSTDLTGDGLVDHHELMMVIDNWTRKR